MPSNNLGYPHIVICVNLVIFFDNYGILTKTTLKLLSNQSNVSQDVLCLPKRNLHSRPRLVQQFSVLQQVCPLHFSEPILQAISTTFVFCLIHQLQTLSPSTQY